MTTEALIKNPLLARSLTIQEEQLLEHGDMLPFQLLLFGCRCNSPFLAEKALKRGADVNRRDGESWTPLMHASYHNAWKVIPLLIKHRAVPYMRDDQGDSALDIAKGMDNRNSLMEFEKTLKQGRLKQAGLFLQTMIQLLEQYKKPRENRSPQMLALCYIDLGYGWWLSEERLDKCFYYFSNAARLHPRSGAFPYATLLASCGYPEEALSWLFKIAKRRWGSISSKDLQNNQAFYCLFNHPSWEELLNVWPRDLG